MANRKLADGTADAIAAVIIVTVAVLEQPAAKIVMGRL